MVIFWISASLMIAAALAFVLPPLIGRVKPADSSRDAMNLVIYRERRQELEAERAAGGLGDEQFAAACAEMDRELLRDVEPGPDPQAPATPRSPYPAIVVAVLVLLALSVPYAALLARAADPTLPGCCGCTSTTQTRSRRIWAGSTGISPRTAP